jgi:thiol-disulfide isomerase/thioredoxin
VRALAVIVLLLSCSESERTVEAEFASYPYRGLPEWEEMPASTLVPIARPEPFVADDRPTVVLFTASWCPPCVGSLMLDIAIAREYADRFRFGIALEESEADFTSSAMGRLFAGIPLWTSDSMRPLAGRCGVRTIPFACVVHRDRIVFRGAPINLRHALDAFGRDTALGEVTARVTATAQLAAGIAPEDVDALVEATRHDPSWQHSIAFAIAARPAPSGTDLVLAVALARAVVALGGGLDYGHLDTYSLALSKAGRPEDAAGVGWRVLSLCRKTQSKCMMERIRANGLIYYLHLLREQGRYP